MITTDLMMALDMDDNLIIANIAEMSKLIEREPDAIKRSELMLHFNAMNIQKDIADYVAQMKHEHNRRITDTEIKLQNHETLVIQGKTVIWIFGGVWATVSAAFIGILIYGYGLIADMRDTITKQSAILPRLEQIIDSSKRQEVILPRIERKMDDKTETSEDFEGRIQAINDELARLKKLRVIKGSR